MGKRLYIGNLGFDVTEKDLQDLFSQAGACESVAVITDRATGQSRGFGFVEMASAADAQKAIQQFDGYELKGRALKVNEAREREGGGGGGGRPGRGGGGGVGECCRFSRDSPCIELSPPIPLACGRRRGPAARPLTPELRGLAIPATGELTIS